MFALFCEFYLLVCMHNVCECACMMCVSVHAMQVVDAREQLCKVNSLHLPLYVFIFFWVELSLYAYGTSALPTGKFFQPLLLLFFRPFIPTRQGPVTWAGLEFTM